MNGLIDFDIKRLELPVAPELMDRLVEFWQVTFGCSFEWSRLILSGIETGYNGETLFTAMCGQRVAGTCRLTISRMEPKLGLVGEVATDPAYRGKGIARYLCSLALNEFRDRGGEALFLATSNPSAEILYSSLGWHKLAGSNVMMNPVNGSLCEEWLVDYYRSHSALSVLITPGNPSHRAPMVPLIITPNDIDLLDSNVQIRSTRYALQPSCEGLYSRYAGIKNGIWFVAQRADGVAVGLASASVQDDNSCCVDAFTHPYYMQYIEPLYDSCLKWAAENKASSLYVICPKSDVYKKSILSTWELDSEIEIRYQTPDWLNN